ncbi:MAG: hypothetical protein J6R37_04925 [Clostridia bacterium]|nr:hypothetical protein [Clostridia bacterium]
MQKIFDYQELDKKLRSIEKELNTNEDRVKGKKLDYLKKETISNLSRNNERAGELETLLTKYKKDYEQLNASVSEYKQAFAEAEDSDELTYLKKKISAVYDQIVSVQKECKALLNESQDLLAKSKELDAKLPKIEEQLQQCMGNFQNILKARQPEVKEIQSKMANLEKEIDPQFVKIYKQVKAQNVFPVFAKLDGNRCGVCRMNLSANTIDQLASNKMVKCEHCNRVIVND